VREVRSLRVSLQVLTRLQSVNRRITSHRRILGQIDGNHSFAARSEFDASTAGINVITINRNASVSCSVSTSNGSVTIHVRQRRTSQSDCSTSCAARNKRNAKRNALIGCDLSDNITGRILNLLNVRFMRYIVAFNGADCTAKSSSGRYSGLIKKLNRPLDP